MCGGRGAAVCEAWPASDKYRFLYEESKRDLTDTLHHDG